MILAIELDLKKISSVIYMHVYYMIYNFVLGHQDWMAERSKALD